MQHNFKWQTPNWLRVLCLTLLVGLAGAGAYAQTLSVYSFAQTSGTYKQSGMGASLTPSGYYDDNNFATVTLPFTFTYHGTAFTSVGISANGFAKLGGTTSTSYAALGSYTDLLSPMNQDLYGNTGVGGNISYTTVGTTPNRVFTIQWANWGFYSSALNEMNFEVKLFETSNNVQFVYGAHPGTTSSTVHVGLSGATNADLQSRTTSTNWSATTAGTSASTCTMSSTVFPANGLIFQWTPAATVAAMTFSQISGTYVPVEAATTCTSLTTDATVSYDDTWMGLQTIPWTFTYHGAPYTTIGVSPNGVARFAGNATASSNYSVMTSTPDVLSPLNADLYSSSTQAANGRDMSVCVIGTAPSRTYVIQWSNWGFFSGGLNEVSFQIRLSEANNAISYAYGPAPGTNSRTAYVGLSGASTADYQGRTTSTNWAATTASAAITNTCTISSTVRPVNGLVFTWAPPLSTPCAGTPAPGTTVASTNPACSGTNFTLSMSNAFVGVSNLSFQWQSNAGAGYTNIAGATNATYTANQTAATSYQCVVTCIGSGLSATSTNLAVPMASFYSCYCKPTYSTGTSSCTYGVISNVTLNTLVHAPACLSAAPYTFYNAPVGAATTSIMQGQTYTLSVTSGIYNGVGVWIDFNQNGIFDASEFFNISGNNNSSGSSWTGTVAVTVPYSAVGGLTGMRVMTAYYCCYPAAITSTNACSVFTYGESEDYVVNILVAPPCSGTPSPGNTIASPASVCLGATATFSLQNLTIGTGVTYQWFNNANPGGIAGATASTYSQVCSGPDNVYCTVTCSGNTGTSVSVALAVNSFFNCYCTSSATSTADEDISNVHFGTLNNTSGCATLAPGPGSVVSMYSNYKSGVGAPAAPNVSQGDNVPFSATMTTCGGSYGNSFKIYIDYNHNGSFSDAGELVWNGPSVTGNHTDAGTISIPMTALTGLTAMRVVDVEGGATSPCGTYTWGETEDYLVNILQALQCAGTPNPGNTLANGTSGSVNVCPGAVNYSLQNFTSGTGVTYQWNNLNGPVTGATNATYSQVMSAYDEIYCDVTCSGLTVSSSVLIVNINSFLNCYCVPPTTVYNCTYDWIGNVTIGTINNTSGCTAPYIHYPASGSTTSTLIAGTSMPISLSCVGYSGYFDVFLDANQDGIFQTSERILTDFMVGPTGSSLGNFTGTTTLNIPAAALSGTTVMRVRYDYSYTAYNGLGAEDPCAQLYEGETEDYTVTVVTLPATPATPIEVGVPNCAVGGTLQSGGTAPIGQTWYWETTATGTSTAQPASSNLSILSNGTYYVRAQDNTYLTWSAASSSVTVTDFPVGPADPATAVSGGNPACGSVTLLSSPALAGITNYWQGTNAVGTSTSSIADDVVNNYPYVASTNGIYYIRAQDNVSYCWSNPVPTTVSIYALPTAPVLTATPGTICPGSTSALTAIAPSAPASGYSVASIPYAPTTPPATTNPGPAGDDVVSGSIPIGFNFSYYGTTYTSFVISTNGFMSFDAAPGSGCCSGQAIPSTVTPNNVIATCWTDLNTGSGGTIDYYNLTSPNRMVVRFNGVAHFGGTPQVTSEIILYETGIIDIHNTSINSQGTMTQGIEGPGGLAATPVPGRNAGAWTATNDAYRFSPIQAFGFMWTPNGPANGMNAGDETLANITVNPSSSINYTMTITDPAHGCQNASSIAVNVMTIAPAPTTVGASTPCGAATVTLTATGTGGTLRWYNAPVGGTLVASGTSSFTTPLINATTTYYVEEYNGACSGPRAPVTATYTPSTSVTASSNVPSVCAGGPAILTASSANPNYAYTWQPGGMTGASVTVNPLVNTTYTLTGVDGFCVNVATVTVLSGPLPTILSVTATPSTMCAGATSQLFAAVLGGSGSTAPTYCSVTNAGSSCITSVILNTLSSTPPSCVSPYYHFNAPTGANTTYLTPGATYTFDLVTAGASIASVWIDFNRNGVYEASEWSQVWTNASSGTISITVPLGATPGATGMRVRSRLSGNINGAGDGCLAMGSGSTEDYVVTIVGGGGFNYSWTGSGLSSSTAYNPTATPSSTNTYVVTVADAITGCTSTGSVVLNVIQLAPAPTVVGGATACGIGTVALSASGTGGTLNWYDAPTGGTLVYTGTSYTTPAISATTTYYVDETNGACTGPRAAVVATFTASYAITATSNVTYVCVGGANSSAVLTASSVNPNYSYTWQPGGMTGASVTVTPTGTTTYTVTGVDGPCSNLATVVVNGPQVPVISSTTATPNVLCGSGTSQLQVNVIGGTSGLATGYCTPVYTYGCGFPDVITDVVFAGINNSTGTTCGQGANLGYDPIYTSPNPSVNAGGTYALSVSTGGDVEGAAVWIDYDHSGTFDAGEEVLSGLAGTNPATYGASVTIPMSAVGGQTMMRVRCTYSANPTGNPCGSVTFGETEDYYVTIVPSAAYNYSWTPTATLSSSTVYNPTAALSSTTSYAVTVSEATYGCSVTSSVSVTVNQPSASTDAVTTCAPIVWNGSTYSTAGLYTYITTNAVGCDSVATLDLTIACSTVVNLTCFIQGYLQPGNILMDPVLSNQGEVSSANACDSIDVELHDMNTYAMAQSVRTVLNRDGTATCVFSSISGDYYIAVKHRNAVQTWSAAPVTVGSTPVSYNFSTAATQAYGDNQIEVNTGVWAFFSGDISIDENVDLLDLNALESDISGFAYGYMPTDLNGDGNVDLLDSPILETNISNFIFSNHP